MDPKYVKALARRKSPWGVHYYANPTNRWIIRGSAVILSTDKEDAAELQRNALSALCFSLGFMNHSKRYEKSVFFQDADKKSNEVKLTERDRKLLIWYYNHVPPGTDSLTTLFEKHWPKSK
jgi:hypothetical protein